MTKPKDKTPATDTNDADALLAAAAEAEKAEAEKAEAEKAAATPARGKGRTVVNKSKNRHHIAGNLIAPGDKYTLTKTDLADDNLVAKVDRAIAIGVLAVVNA